MLTFGDVKKALFLGLSDDDTSGEGSAPGSNPSNAPVTVAVLTHYADLSTQESFVHPSGLGFLLQDAHLIDCDETDSGELRLEFIPGPHSDASDIEGWTLVFAPVPSSDDPEPPPEK